MNNIINPAWKNDLVLKAELEKLVIRRYTRKEILTLVGKKYQQYAWSLSSLRYRLKHFEIKYINYETQIDNVYEAVSKELEGPGSKLGYRSMTQKIREVHSLKVPRDLVYGIMCELDPDGLESRGGVGLSKKKKRQKRFVSPGSNYCISIDGHDKLCGYQKSTFPLCIYGGQDTFSGKIMFLKIWTSNNNPEVTAYHYFEHIAETKELPHTIRVDRGTETDLMTSIHCRLHQLCGTHNDFDQIVNECVLFGPSTANKIERWWRELHHRMESFFKEQLSSLLSSLLEFGHYDQTSKLDRDMLAFVYIPVVQKELDIFRETVWNHKRGRKQENKQLPTGIPDYIHENPEEYDSSNWGTAITEEQLLVVAEETSVVDIDSFIDEDLKTQFEEILNADDVEPADAANAFVTLKRTFVPLD